LELEQGRPVFLVDRDSLITASHPPDALFHLDDEDVPVEFYTRMMALYRINVRCNHSHGEQLVPVVFMKRVFEEDGRFRLLPWSFPRGVKPD
jgi:hypothetical protein